MGTLLLALSLIAVAWLLAWTVIAERTMGKDAHAWPFGYMTTEEYLRRHKIKHGE